MKVKLERQAAVVMFAIDSTPLGVAVLLPIEPVKLEVAPAG